MSAIRYRVDLTDNDDFCIETTDGKRVCSRVGVGHFYQRREEAVNLCAILNCNAELLEALELTPLDEHPPDERGICLCSQCKFRRAARTAIAKATGGVQ